MDLGKSAEDSWHKFQAEVDALDVGILGMTLWSSCCNVTDHTSISCSPQCRRVP